MFKILQIRQFYSGARLPSDFPIILNKGNLSKQSYDQLYANKFMVTQSVYGIWSYEKEKAAIDFVRLYNKQLSKVNIRTKSLRLDEKELVRFLQFRYDNNGRKQLSEHSPFWFKN
jgi:hypothetical protein